MEGEEGERKEKLNREDSRRQTRREAMCTQDNVTCILSACMQRVSPVHLIPL